MADAEDKESLARAHFPYRAEYCPTSRAKCKKCGDFMKAGTLKLANMTKSRFHDGYDANFHHVDCFFRVKRPNSVAEIRHFETLKYEDQKMLEKAVETKGKSVLCTKDEEESKVKKKGDKKRAPPGELVNYEDFLVEYAKSNRSKCNLCDQKIEKATVRLGKLDYAADTNWNGGPVPRWFHVDCFEKSLDQLEFFGQVDKIPNFVDLEKEDRRMLKNKIKPKKPPSDDEVSGKEGNKKVKIEEVKPDPDETKEENLLKEQSDRFFKLREFVTTMKRKDIETMLDYMDQKSDYKASALLIEMATDILLFGPLERCPECKQRKTMQLRGSSYICTYSTESGPCTYESRDPKRGVPDVPDEIIEKYEFFETYRFRGGKRIFPSKFIKAVQQREAEENNIVLEGAPLDGLIIGVISWNALKNDKAVVQKKVITLGGKLVTALDKSVFVILTNKNELEKDTPKIEVAKALDIPFATDDFLFNIKTKDDVVPQLSKSLIYGKWEGDIKERFNKMAK